MSDLLKKHRFKSVEELKVLDRDILKKIADELSKVGVHLLLSGHHHRALSGDLSQIGGEGSMLVLHAGTAISTRTRGGEGNTYNLVCTTKDQVSVRVMGWMAGRGFREVREASYVFVERRWRARE